MSQTERIQLCNLNFANNSQPQPPDPVPNPALNQARIAADQPSHPASDPEPHERLAAEKPGCELAPGSAIWQMYINEAKDQDTELVDGRNKNLDMMLLFAALFSAILTAFIIESKTLLQQDPADVSVKLLLAIAQSQQRIEQGVPMIMPAIELPQFSPPMSARWINGLWYTALTLSLTAALVAMLAKEWLIAFTTSRPRPPYMHALLHQERLQGLSWWRALHIIDFLPTVLHISLLLFFAGLVVYLLALDTAIAIAVATITGLTVLFYLATALLGAIHRCCPYVTQISKYLCSYLGPLSRDIKSIESCLGDIGSHAGMGTQDGELFALLWLAENARDPAVGDCACQALAGLRIPDLSPPVPPHTSLRSKVIGGIRARLFPNGRAPWLLSRYTLLSKLCATVCTRLSQARIRLSQEPAKSRGLNMARYANAMPNLVYSFDKEAANNATRIKLNSVAESPAELIVNELDFIWGNTCPALGPDTYALFVSAELRMVEVMACGQATSPAHFLAKTAAGSSPNHPFNPRNALGAILPTYMQHSGNITSGKSVSLFDLQARYSRALCYAGLFLSYHNSRCAPISSIPLSYLLESILLAAQCAELNPGHHMSTCLPQSEGTDALPAFDINIKHDRAHTMNPLELGNKYGVIAGLVELISSADTVSATVLGPAAAGERALFVFGPMLLRQWVHLMNESPEHRLDQYRTGGRTVESLLQSWPLPHRRTDHIDDPVQRTLIQLLIIATIAVSLADCPEMSDLPNIAVAALARRASTVCGKAAILDVALKHRNLLSELVHYAYLNQDHLNTSTRERLLQLLLFKHSNNTLFRAQYMSLRASDVPFFLDATQRILDLITSGTYEMTELEGFMSDVMGVIHSLDPAAKRTAENCPTLTAVYLRLKAIPDLHEGSAGLETLVADDAKLCYELGRLFDAFDS